MLKDKVLLIVYLNENVSVLVRARVLGLLLLLLGGDPRVCWWDRRQRSDVGVGTGGPVERLEPFVVVPVFGPDFVELPYQVRLGLGRAAAGEPAQDIVLGLKKEKEDDFSAKPNQLVILQLTLRPTLISPNYCLTGLVE